jgi:hypothetical protein
VFGWGYFGLARWYSNHQGPMPAVRWQPGSGAIENDLRVLPPYMDMAHNAWALAFAFFGSILAGLLFKHSSAREHESTVALLASRLPAGCWRRPAFAAFLGFGFVIAAVLAGWQSGPEIGAGAAILLTWAVMGLAALGAVCARGCCREAWFGAASFGIGYLIVAFSPILTMALPTDHFLNAVFRPGGPTPARVPTDDDLTTDDGSRRVREALHESIALHLSDANEPRPFGEDPVMIAGHSLLALVAAAVGAVGAMLVASLLGRHSLRGDRLDQGNER